MSTQKEKISVRWGIPALDDKGGLYIYGFMLRNYAKAGVTRDEFLCIEHLAAYCYESENGQSSPGLAKITELMGYEHENSVRNLMKSLVKKGMLKIEHRNGDTSIYDLHGFAAAVLALECTPTSQCTPTPTLECTPPLHPNVPEEVKEEEKKKNTRTPREKTPIPDIIRALQLGTSRWPNKAIWEALCKEGEGLQPSALTTAAQEWLSRGYKPNNFSGIISVARHGWHETPRNGNGHTPTTTTPERAELERDAAETRRRMLAGEI